MKEITSRDNKKLKLAKRIRDGKVPDKIFIEGSRLATEVLKSNIKINEVFVSQDFIENEKNQDLINKLPQQIIYKLPANLLNSISDTKNPQGIVLSCDKPDSDYKSFLVEKEKKQTLPHIVLLHKINNPSNLGAISRTAEAVCIKGIIITKESANAFSPKSLRASMGSIMRIPIWENADFDEILEWAKENKLRTICADVNSTNNYTHIDWKVPSLIVFGSEAHGLSHEERKKISENMLIPMENKVESLNLAVSCGVILFEIKRHF